MPAAPAATAAIAEAAPTKAGRKKLIILVVAALLALVLVGGGAAMLLLKKKPADNEDDIEDAPAKVQVEAGEPAKGKPRHDPKHPPTFLPLDPFTVNLADRESERYAQVGITLEIDDAHTADELRAYMPAIRNNILMVLSHKTAAQLLTREGKERLAKGILYAAVRPLGFEPGDDDAEEDAAINDDTPRKKRRKKKVAAALPVTAVHFSNFIIQ